jgi:hypothetical protein
MAGLAMSPARTADEASSFFIYIAPLIVLDGNIEQLGGCLRRRPSIFGETRSNIRQSFYETTDLLLELF